MNTLTDNTRIPVEEIEKIKTEIANVAPGYMAVLTPDNILYKEPEDELIRPISQLAVTAETIRAGIGGWEDSVFCEIYDGSGARVYPQGEAWRTATDGIKLWEVQRHANAVAVLNGGLLYVSRGIWFAAEEIEGAPEPTFRFVGTEQMLRLLNEKRRTAAAAWLALHPEVEALKPAWATSTHVEVDEDLAAEDQRQVDITFTLENAVADVSVMGEWTATDGIKVKEPSIRVEVIEDKSADETIRLLESAIGLVRQVAGQL